MPDGKVVVTRRQPRRYNGVVQLFHNSEHDPRGLNHCTSNGQMPYRIEHVNGKHKITAKVAVGHGRAGKPQTFCFTRRMGNGWDLASGKRITRPQGRVLLPSGKLKKQRRRKLKINNKNHNRHP